MKHISFLSFPSILVWKITKATYAVFSLVSLALFAFPNLIFFFFFYKLEISNENCNFS